MVSSSVCFGAIAFVFGMVCITKIDGYSLPSFITPCFGLDSECLTKKGNEHLKEFAKGIPELEVRPLDPCRLDKMNVDLGGLNVKLKNVIVKGLSKCSLEKLEISQATHKILIDLKCNITVDAKYETKGQLLLLNLEGDGDAKVKIKKLAVKVEIDFSYEKRDGEYYLRVHKKYKHSSKVHGYAHFDLSNLFGGNKELGDPILRFMNQNWEQLYSEFSGPILNKAIELAVANINNFFSKLPRSVLTPGFDELYKQLE